MGGGGEADSLLSREEMGPGSVSGPWDPHRSQNQESDCQLSHPGAPSIVFNLDVNGLVKQRKPGFALRDLMGSARNIWLVLLLCLAVVQAER